MENHEKHSPLDHFKLDPIVPIELPEFMGGLDLSLNKGIFVMWAALAVAFILFMIAIKSKLTLIPGKLQSILELYLQMIKDIVDDNIGGEEGDKYLPFIASIFLFIFFCNLAGLIPGSYTITSQLVVTGTFSISIFIMTLIIGVSKHGGHFISILVPPGVPKIMIPFLVPIELLSQLSRPLTLALRLFGNMTAGHILLGVIFGMAMAAPMIVNILPFGFTVLLYGMEVFVSAIQAYIFTLLTCVYIGDVIKLH